LVAGKLSAKAGVDPTLDTGLCTQKRPRTRSRARIGYPSRHFRAALVNPVEDASESLSIEPDAVKTL